VEPCEIRAVVRQYLGLIEGADLTVVEDETLLPVLDHLAFAQQFVRFTFDPTEYPDPPRRDQAAFRQSISKRFPTCGYYNLPEFVTKEIAESKCVVADAIDDILDIGNDLLAVEWCWANTSEADALWHFQNSYSSHWQAHLRGLQFYILSRYWEAA
jgi:hypothetical protein